MSNRPDWSEWILKKNQEAKEEALKKSKNISLSEDLAKGKARKERREQEREGKIKSLSNSKVHAISTADAISGTHGYNVHTTDLGTGKTTSAWKSQDATKIRLKNPDATHLIHHEHDKKGTPVSKEVAEAARKTGKFNYHNWLSGGSGSEEALAASTKEFEKEELIKAKDMAGDNVDSGMLMSELESLKHHVNEIEMHLKKSDVAPDWVKSKVTRAASIMSDIAHYIMGLKEIDKK